MASLLQKSTPWIEDSFVYACSFDASRCDDDEDNASDEDFNDDEEMEPPTQNTIPAGLHDDDDDDDSHDGNNGLKGRNKPPPSRGSKLVQIIDRGGDPNFYATEQQNDCCPPYLILHDGQYSTIAFLSEEAYNSSMMRQHNAAATSVRRGGAAKQPPPPKPIPKKSLISISQYTISTIKCCCTHQPKSQQQQQQQSNNMLTLQLVRPDMPQPHLSQIQSTLNTNLLLCLYLLGPITLIGGENQGLIGNTINVNCSIKVRRVLLSHMAQFDKVHEQHTDGVCVNPEEEEEEEDYQHWTMVQRLEACHCYYQLLKERQGGSIPMWPWESRLVDGEKDDDNADEDGDEEEIASDDQIADGAVKSVAATTAAIPTAASPGRVERMIRKYENLEELLQEQEEEEEDGDDTANVAEDDAVGDKRAGRASTGTYLANWDDSEEDHMEEEEEEEMEVEKEGNAAGEQVQQQQQQQQEEEKGGEEEEEEKDTNAKKDDAPIEQGNVAELFDNFEDINDVLDLEEDASVTEEGEASTSANAMFDPNENYNGIDDVVEQGEDNKVTEETNITQDDNAATFVGIDQMIVDDDDEDEEEEEEEEEEDNDEQAPLLTQQEFDTYKDDETKPASKVSHPPQEVTESQIPLPPVEVDKQSTKLSRGDGHTMEYVESQIPLPPPKSTQSVDEENGDDIRTESQIAFSFAQSSDESASEDEENDGDMGTESQIPFPPRKKQPTQVSRQTCDDDEGMYPAESQVPIPQKQPAKNAHSPRKPDVSAAKILKERPVRPKRAEEIIYDSDDDWMRIRKVKSSSKSTKRTLRVQSQIAGEGSEESIPSNNLLDTSQIIDNDENEAVEEDSAGIPQKEMQQQPTGSTSTAQKTDDQRSRLPKRNTATSSNAGAASTDHRVRFAIDNANQHSQPLPATAAALSPPVLNQRELFTSVSNKASKILLQSSKVSNEPASRKRKDSEDEGGAKKKKEFSFRTIFGRAKRYCPSYPDEEV